MVGGSVSGGIKLEDRILHCLLRLFHPKPTMKAAIFFCALALCSATTPINVKVCTEGQSAKI
jgi:hypothetical protein